MNALLEKFAQKLSFKMQFQFLAILDGIALIIIHFNNRLEFVIGLIAFNVAVALWFGFRTARRANVIVSHLQAMAAGNLSQKIRLDGKDDFSWMAYESDTARKGMAALIKGATETAAELQASAQEMNGISSRTTQAIASQGEHTSQIAASITQLAEQIREVSAQATQVAGSAKQANTVAIGGSKVVGETIRSLETISHDVEGIAESIMSLQDEIDKISSVMQVIRDISEQTNLLALNAAIEAARAGEAGRGFAVVADEVRNLSQRTSKSTEETTKIINSLQAKSQQVAKTVREKQHDANTAASSAKAAEKALDGIVGAVQEIVSVSDVIATLTSRQEVSAGGITETVTYIEGLSRQNAIEAAAFSGMSQQLSAKAGNLSEMVSKFTV